MGEGDDLPLEGRLVALDLGSVRVGVATSDPSQVVASPAETVAVAADESDAVLAVRLADRVRELGAAGVVVGDPRGLDGRVGEASRRARAVAAGVRVASGLPVRLVDERFTTTEAERVLIEADVSRAGRRQVVDRVAAAVLLQGVLASQARLRGVRR